MLKYYPRTDAEKSTKLYENLNLFVTSEAYYVQPIENESVLLHIDRVTEEMSLRNDSRQIPPRAERIPFFGVLGRIQLIGGYYLMIITERKLTGRLSGHDIWQIKNIDVVPIPKASLHLNRKQEEANKIYVNMLRSAFSAPGFYYSYTYDITHTAQRLHNTAPDFLNIPMFKRADPHFTWNSYLLEQFCISPDFHKFCVPVIHGFVSINEHTFWYTARAAEADYKSFTWSLISRRHCRRAGTRLYRRGIDHSGNVANFVETEQIVEYLGAQSSFVQIRGSIPLFWTQYPNMKLKPPPVIVPLEKHTEACRKHLDNMTHEYGKMVLINLIDQKGREAELEKKFRAVVEEVGNHKVKYEAYDFHQECKNMQYQKLNFLVNKISDDQDQFGYFMLDHNKRLVSSQEGVFRTNCIDCLDRTNVVQSLIAWRSLSAVLGKLQLLTGSLGIVEGELEFYKLFQHIWANHADYISTQYSGTKALKTDYTRTGRRTYNGALNDGGNSLLRYYKNNLRDGFRQDSIDLVLGSYKVSEAECITDPCPVNTSPKWKSLTLQMILLFAVAMFFANTIFINEFSTSSFLSIFFWGAMIFITMSTMVHYGTEFVDYPRLCPLDLKRIIDLPEKCQI